MARPSKPASVLKQDKRSHRTKEELALREKGESALLTGIPIQEDKDVRHDKVAHKAFQRMISLLDKIKKNDAIYEASINRYCMLLSECADIAIRKDKIYECVDVLQGKLSDTNNTDSIIELSKSINETLKRATDCDKLIQNKRTMLFALEKENAMTIASALRSIPKAPEDNKSPLLRILSQE